MQKLINTACALGGAGLLSLTLTSQAAANQTQLEHPVHSLAQGCYAVHSPQNGKYLQIVPGGGNYQFADVNINQAAHFYFKPTALNKFMLFDRYSGYLASRLPRDPDRGTYAGDFAEYQVEHHSNGLYKLRNTKFGDTLKDNGGLYFIDLLNPYNQGSVEDFELIPQNDCLQYPEISLNLTEHYPEEKTSEHEPVKGFMDNHMHITSWMFMGGKFLHGKPYHRFGVTKALDDGSGYHGPYGALDLVGNLMATGDVNSRHDTRGWPDFPYWPTQETMSHQQAYYRWIERAHKAGLKLAVAQLVENNVLCQLQTKILPPNWLGRNTCDEMQSIRNQNAALHDMQAYIDAQAGGPGKGFMRIVTSPEEARRAIANGKLAIIKGIEISRMFNCNASGCSKEHVENEIQSLYDMGVRSFFPVHRFDNAFGGAWLKGANDLMNAGNYLQNGYLFKAKACEGENQTWGRLPNGFPLINEVSQLRGALDLLLGSIGLSSLWADYDQSAQTHCNSIGLTDTGRYLINAMIDREMVIEIDHMSYEMQQDVLEILEKRGYSGVITGHDAFTGSKIDHQILALGGAYGFYMGHSGFNNGMIDKILNAQKDYPYASGMSFGSDVNGLAKQAPANTDGEWISYPFTSMDGRVTFEQQQSGNRYFDINQDGMAHYGLMPDMIESMRVNLPKDENGEPRTEILDALFNGAEAYLQMWERAEKQNFIVNTPPEYSQMYLPYLGKCLSAEGTWNGAKVHARECNMSLHELWIQRANGSIASAANPNKCIDLAGAIFVPGRDYQMWDCNGTKAQLFSEPRQHDAGRLRMQHAIHACIDVKHWGEGSKIEFQPCRDYSPGQTFMWRKKTLNNYRVLNSVASNTCIDLPGFWSSLQMHNNVKVNTYACTPDHWDQQWRYEPLTGLIHNRENPLFCLDHGSKGAGFHVELYRCTPSNNQTWTENWHDDGTVSYHPRNAEHLVMRPANQNLSTSLIIAYTEASHPLARWNVREKEFYQLQFKRTGKCMSFDPNYLSNGNTVRIDDCRSADYQKFRVTKDGKIRTMLDPSLCVKYAAGDIDSHLHLWDCDAYDDQGWIYNGSTLHPKHNPSLVVEARDGNAHINNTQLVLEERVVNKEQGWFISHGVYRSAYRMLKNKQNGKCFDLNHARAEDGNFIHYWPCDGNKAQLWAYEEATGYLRSAVNPAKCAAHPDGMPVDGLAVKLWDCSINQAWDFDSEVFRSRTNPDYAIGFNEGRAVLWKHHGALYQRWYWH